MTKICPCCKKELVPVENFRIGTSNSSGIRYIIACNNCRVLIVGDAK